MQLENIKPDDLNLDAAGTFKTAPTPLNIEKTSAAPDAPGIGDSTDVSKLSRMMDEAAHQLKVETAVRPEKIEQFKGLVDGDVAISDAQIDVIVQRMLDN